MKFSIKRFPAIAAVLPAVLVLFTTSCKKEEVGSKEMMVFLQPDVPGIPTFTQAIDLLHTPADVRGEKTTEVFVFASREVDKDVSIYIKPDPDKLAAYNDQYGLNCLLLPANSYSLKSGEKYTIVKGQREATPITIEITSPGALTNPAGYVLPISIDKIETGDKGVGISNTHRTVYIKVNYAYTNVELTQTPVTGTLGTRTGWVATVSNTTSGAPATSLLDGNNSTAWRSSNSATAEKWLQIDMGASRQLKGLQMTPNYVATAENGTRITVSTSADNTTWTVQGVWEGTGPATGTNATNPDLKGITFIAPVNARYFRLTYNAWVSGNRVGMAEIHSVE